MYGVFSLIYRRQKCETCWFKLRESSNIFYSLQFFLHLTLLFSSDEEKQFAPKVKYAIYRKLQKIPTSRKTVTKKMPFQDTNELISHEPLTFISCSFRSVYLTLCVTVERYVAVCLPLRARSICTHR